MKISAPLKFDSRVSSTLLDINSDSLHFTYRDSTMWLPFSDIEKLQVSTGTRRNTGRGALIGAGAIGIPFGLFTMANTGTCSEDDFICFKIEPGATFTAGFLAGGAAGALAGGLIGYHTITDKWENVKISPQPPILYGKQQYPGLRIKVTL